ncbi:hypothetical protein AKI68_07770 [Streptococcus pneumoniae]|nr:tyrosine-type recombinase/integrase [Streptococcus pneumoniae]KYA24071.1 hypothetical protein AKI68_07770 [Streptococcus pneumoniae]
MKDFELHLKKAGLAENTVRSYLYGVRFFLENYELKMEDLFEYKGYLLDNFKPKTVNLRLQGVNKYLAFIGHDDLKLKFVKVQQKPFLEDVISHADYLFLKRSLKKDGILKWHFVVWFLGATGARVSELIKLKVEHVEIGYFDIYSKGGKIRRLYIPKKLRNSCLSWLESENRRSGYLFLNKFNEPITARGVAQQLKNYADKYKMNPKVIYPHSFRHLFAKNFLAKYNDIALLADLMGHESIETTRIYLRKTATEQHSYYGNKDETTSYPIYEIPEAWRYIKFASLVNFRIGKTPPRSEATFWGTEIPWVSISDMPISGYVTNTRESISKLALKSKKIDISPKGTLLMSFKLSIGKVAILDIPATHNEAIISIFPYANKENIIRDYLMIFLPLISTLGDSKDAIKGKTLNSTSISELLIPISNHEEMKRIISKVDLLFQKVSQLFE